MKTITTECKIEITDNLIEAVLSEVYLLEALNWYKNDYSKGPHIYEYIETLKGVLKELGEIDE